MSCRYAWMHGIYICTPVVMRYLYIKPNSENAVNKFIVPFFSFEKSYKKIENNIKTV